MTKPKMVIRSHPPLLYQILYNINYCEVLLRSKCNKYKYLPTKYKKKIFTFYKKRNNKKIYLEKKGCYKKNTFEKYLLFVTISLQWHGKSFGRGLEKVLTSPLTKMEGGLVRCLFFWVGGGGGVLLITKALLFYCQGV